MELMIRKPLMKYLGIGKPRSPHPKTYPLGQTSPAPIARDKEAELLLGASRTEMNAAATDPSLSVGTVAVCKTKNLVSELCQQFYALGWVSGTGGSVAIKVHDETTAKSQQLIVASPSGVQKERMVAEDMFVFSSNGLVLSTPPSKAYPRKPPKCSDSTSIFLKVYELCIDAGAVMHSHGIESCLVTMIKPLMKEFRISHMEMIKGIQGHGYHDELVIPIIENTAQEGELVESLTEAIRSYPKATAVLVRNHGVYIWGDTWISAKTQAECYHYLFDAAVKLHQMGLDLSSPEHGRMCNNHHKGCSNCCSYQTCPQTESLVSDIKVDIQQRYILLSTEGTSLQSSDNWVGRTSDDVPKALKMWHASGIKIYSIGCCSRKEQHFLFCNSRYGDLRKYLSGYFDATLGSKKERGTYMEILLTVGVDRAADMLFVTDNIQAAFAAKAAGLEAILTLGPGIEALAKHQGVRTVQSMLEVC